MFSQTLTRAFSRLGLDQRGPDPHPRQPAPAAGYKAETVGLAALSLTQIGEFSYFLAGVGLKEALIGRPSSKGFSRPYWSQLS